MAGPSGPAISFNFYPRSPCGERLPSKLKPPVKTHNFYPRSPCGERPGCQRPCERPTKDFYPRSPCGERHDTTSLMKCQARFLSTLSLRRATGSDRGISSRTAISIHALLAESDLLMLSMVAILTSFLSTLSLRRATTMGVTVLGIQHNFYPRSPCGERRGAKTIPTEVSHFYPRSPCGERHQWPAESH